MRAHSLLQRARGSILRGQEGHQGNQTTTAASVSTGGDGAQPIAGSEGARHRAIESAAAKDIAKGTVDNQRAK